MRGGLGFRFWFYFRSGWESYFALLFGSINMLTVTYYLAVESIPALKGAFPSFYIYVATFAAVGVPLVVSMGYVHFKKSLGHRAEVDIRFETDPYLRRILRSVEYSLELHLRLVDPLLRISGGGRPTPQQLEEISRIGRSIGEHMGGRGAAGAAPR